MLNQDSNILKSDGSAESQAIIQDIDPTEQQNKLLAK